MKDDSKIKVKGGGIIKVNVAFGVDPDWTRFVQEQMLSSICRGIDEEIMYGTMGRPKPPAPDRQLEDKLPRCGQRAVFPGEPRADGTRGPETIVHCTLLAGHDGEHGYELTEQCLFACTARFERDGWCYGRCTLPAGHGGRHHEGNLEWEDGVDEPFTAIPDLRDALARLK